MQFKQQREAAGLTQKELAGQMGVTQQAVAKWEKGIGGPTIDKLPKLARILGTTVDALLAEGGEDDGNEQPLG